MFCRYRFPKLMTCNVFRHRFSLMEISRNRSGEASCWKTSCWLFFGRQRTIYCPVWIQFIFHLVNPNAIFEQLRKPSLVDVVPPTLSSPKPSTTKCFSKCPSSVRCWFKNPVNYSSLHLPKTIEKQGGPFTNLATFNPMTDLRSVHPMKQSHPK